MDLKRVEIGKGIYLNYDRKEGHKTGLIRILFISELDREKMSDKYVVFNVFNKSTEKYPKLIDIKRRTYEIYAPSISSRTYKHGDNSITEFNCSVFDRKYTLEDYDTTGTAIDLLEQFIFHPNLIDGKLSTEIVDRVKTDAIHSIRSIKNYKNAYAQSRMLRNMLGNTPYGVSDAGEVEDIAKVDCDSLYETYQNLVKTSRIEIFAVGTFDFDYLCVKFKEMFSHIERSDIYELHTKQFICPENTEYKKVYEQEEVNQGRLVLGFGLKSPIEEEDRVRYRVFNDIYGDGLSSRLFVNVREKLSLCYGCGSSINIVKGFLSVSAGIKFENEQKAFDEIMRQLDDLRAGNITQEELEVAKINELSVLNNVENEISSVCGWHVGEILTGHYDGISIEKKKNDIQAVSADDVMRQANNVVLNTYYFMTGKDGNNG